MGRAQGLRNPALSGEASKYLKTGWGAGRNRVACECPKLASTQEGREEVGAGGGGVYLISLSLPDSSLQGPCPYPESNLPREACPEPPLRCRRPKHSGIVGAGPTELPEEVIKGS